MTRISSTVVLAAVIAFISSAVYDTSAASLPTRDVAEENLQDRSNSPSIGTVRARDTEEQDATSEQASAQIDWCPWGFRWNPWWRRCERWNNNDHWSRDAQQESSEHFKRDGLEARQWRDSGWGGYGGGRGGGWGGPGGGWSGPGGGWGGPGGGWNGGWGGRGRGWGGYGRE